MKKILFTITSMLCIIGIVSAATYLVNKHDTLSNTVSGNTTTRNTIEGSATFNRRLCAQVREIEEVSGINAAGGVRVKTIAKKTVLGITTSEKEIIVPVQPSLVGQNAIGASFIFDSDSNKVKVQWQNWTGNTIVTARFVAYNEM